MCDIRLSTVLIVKKDSKYLVGKCMLTGKLKWSDSPWDAWHTRTRAKARSVNEKIGGDILLFNPIVGQLKYYQHNDILY